MMTFDVVLTISTSFLKPSSWPITREKWDLPSDMIFSLIWKIISSTSFLNTLDGFSGEYPTPFPDRDTISLSRKGCAAIHNVNSLPNHLLIPNINSKLTVLRIYSDSMLSLQSNSFPLLLSPRKLPTWSTEWNSPRPQQAQSLLYLSTWNLGQRAHTCPWSCSASPWLSTSRM